MREVSDFSYNILSKGAEVTIELFNPKNIIDVEKFLEGAVLALAENGQLTLQNNQQKFTLKQGKKIKRENQKIANLSSVKSLMLKKAGKQTIYNIVKQDRPKDNISRARARLERRNRRIHAAEYREQMQAEKADESFEYRLEKIEENEKDREELKSD